MKRIASKDNPVFRQLLRLESSSRERRNTGKALLDGIHLVDACMKSGSDPELIVIRESSLENPQMIPFTAHRHAVSMSDALFDRISPVKSPTGILALFDIPGPEKTAHADFCIFLEAIQDPGNIGSILRAAAASGLRDAFLSEGCADAWSPKTLRAGMGAHFALRIHEDADIAAILEDFPGNSVAMTLDAEKSLFDLDLAGSVGFVIGNEGAGISEAILSLCKTRAKIPMPGMMESLNAAQAASICLFERVRQKS